MRGVEVSAVSAAGLAFVFVVMGFSFREGDFCVGLNEGSSKRKRASGGSPFVRAPATAWSKGSYGHLRITTFLTRTLRFLNSGTSGIIFRVSRVNLTIEGKNNPQPVSDFR